MWKIDLKIEDLNLSDEEMITVSSAVNDGERSEEAVKLIKSKYLSGSPATFLPPPQDRKAGVGLVGNPDNGKLIYENSCLHCHYQKKYSFMNLDNKKMSFNFLNAHAGGYSKNSLYQVTRYGTYSKYGKRSYMPQYPAEKMSDQQLADLRAYIEQRAAS